MMNEEAIGNTNYRLANLHFSERHLKIIYLLAEGLTEKEIGERLGISFYGIKSACRALREKFYADNTAGIVGLAFKERIII